MAPSALGDLSNLVTWMCKGDLSLPIPALLGHWAAERQGDRQPLPFFMGQEGSLPAHSCPGACYGTTGKGPPQAPHGISPAPTRASKDSAVRPPTVFFLTGQEPFSQIHPWPPQISHFPALCSPYLRLEITCDSSLSTLSAVSKIRFLQPFL